MKKRIITLSMAICLAFSLSVPVFAANSSLSTQVDQDMAAMSNAYFNVDAITVSSINEDGTITYLYQLTEDVFDYVTVSWTAAGDALLNIKEDNRHNVITVLADGTLLFDGAPLNTAGTVIESDDQAVLNPGIMLRKKTEYYFSTLPHIGTPSSYTSGPSVFKNPCITFTKKLREETGALIGSAIATSLFPGNALAEKAVSEICSRIGAKIRSRAEATADANNKLSYISSLYGHPQSDTFEIFLRYYNKFYSGANYVDKNPMTEIFYEHRVIYS